jgi:hypothetical protein
MNLSRRSFLRAGSMMSLTAVLSGRISSIAFGQQNQLGSGLGTPIPKAALDDPFYKITRAMFTENLKTKFGVSLGGVKLGNFVLIGVEDLNPSFYKSDGTGTRDCFSLKFKGPMSLPLRQGTYTFQQGKLGTFQLFIVPGDTSGQSVMRYDAIINRLYP